MRIKLSNPIKPGELEQAYTDGMFRKSQLVDGKYYRGHCRNAAVARWSAEKGCFTYMRSKFGTRFPEDIFHPENDDGFDLFIALEEADPTPDEKIPDPHDPFSIYTELKEAEKKITPVIGDPSLDEKMPDPQS